MGPGFPLPRTIGNGAEYQLGHYVPTDILPSCVRPSGSVPRICQARLILPAVPDGPAFGLRPAVSEKPFIMETKYQVPHNAAPDILSECRLLFYSWHVLHGQALPGSMSGSLKTILRGSTSRVNMPNAQSNDCARSPTNDGNGNATGRDLAAGSLNAPPRLWQLPYTKLSPPYHSPAQRRFGISGAE